MAIYYTTGPIFYNTQTRSQPLPYLLYPTQSYMYTTAAPNAVVLRPARNTTNYPPGMNPPAPMYYPPGVGGSGPQFMQRVGVWPQGPSVIAQWPQPTFNSTIPSTRGVLG